MKRGEERDVDCVNEQIRAREVRLVGEDGKMVGVVNRDDALRMARNAGLDLVEVVDNVVPPVCKIVDYGKYKYERSKKERADAAKTRANQIHVREIQLRPVTDDNDISIKARKAKQFLEDGDKVKIKVKFRGREVTHHEKGREVITQLIGLIGFDIAFEKDISLQGRDMIAVIASK